MGRKSDLSKPPTLPAIEAAHLAALAHLITDKEMEALVLVANGLTEYEAAKVLNVRGCTIDNRLFSLRHRLGAANNEQAIACALVWSRKRQTSNRA